ncbi:hypothetical protein G3N18_02045 [Microbacterium sp. 2C]|uniref:hypothetical protein n=1 Tax=Microbacterium paulum TaxID=2707006 RepID=UPI0018C2588A|nr:hypothetical protein [Microbacterium paulum]MBG0716869.1 hypothetical protein [Microbacterium paulum]
MSSREGEDDAVIGADLLAQLQENATVLGVFDEGQDIALDLHEELFSPTTRQRALAFLNSDRYQDAATKFRRLNGGIAGEAS